MQKVSIAILLWLGASMTLTHGMFVSHEEENEMKEAIYNLINSTRNSNEQRLLVPGIIRFCFHDCVITCDGCIDTRRKVQGGNNGLEITWRLLKGLYHKRFSGICSRADFVALACVVTADFAGERGEQEETCVNPTDASGLPLVPNRCRPNMKVLWGRRTCDVPQQVEPLRNLPDANQDPYEWFAENMDMTPREAVCIMGSHALGRLRKNETGFEGEYTTRFDVLSNEYFQTMTDESTVWTQEKNFVVIDNVPQTRHQWVEPDHNLTRVNSDIMLVYNLTTLNNVGRTKCVVPPKKENRWNKHCKKQDNFAIVADLAKDNVAFIKCFGEAMDKMMHTGYGIGELVETGVEIPPPPRTTRAPKTTTSTTPRPVAPSRPTRRRGLPRNRNRVSRRGRRGRSRNRLPGQQPQPRPQQRPQRRGQTQPQSGQSNGIARLTQQIFT